MKYSKEDQLRKTIKDLKAKKKELTMSQLKKKVQRVFNAWIRERDKNDMCISCGGICGDWDCGHFWNQGNNGALRYHEDNCHKQGRGCNRYKHGNLLEYEQNLIKKIGQERVDYLRDNRKATRKWTRDELNELLEKYK